MKKHWFLALLLATSAFAFGDDQQKAIKELSKVTAMASDGTGRTVVNQSMAEMLNAKRPDLVIERRNTGLNYGSLFIAHALTAAGAKMDDVATQLKAGKKIQDLANEQHANWKQIADDAKKLNAKIDDNLYKRFLDTPKAKEGDQADKYDLVLDGVPADNTASENELAQAGDRYQLWKGRADDAAKRNNKLSTADQGAAYVDHARAGGPGGSNAPGANSGTGGPIK